jgi:hypothetical protein
MNSKACFGKELMKEFYVIKNQTSNCDKDAIAIVSKT